MNARSFLASRNRAASAAFTLVELLASAAMLSIILGAALVTFIGVQRSVTTSLYQVNAQSDQNRVFAYVRRDLRGASNVQIAAQGTELTITLPTQAAPTLNLNLGLPLLSLLGPSQTPNASDTIRYYRQGTSVIRELNGAPTVLSTSATLFQATLNGSLVQIDAAFQPRFTLGTRATSSAATTATAYVHLLNATSN
ncbi:MAG TPA: hypothetical protein VK961_01180 [Chthoniobacter sp.]|nr:hypothetical protein [Chthoniobacter sp.]